MHSVSLIPLALLFYKYCLFSYTDHSLLLHILSLAFPLHTSLLCILPLTICSPCLYILPTLNPPYFSPAHTDCCHNLLTPPTHIASCHNLCTPLLRILHFPLSYPLHTFLAHTSSCCTLHMLLAAIPFACLTCTYCLHFFIFVRSPTFPTLEWVHFC